MTEFEEFERFVEGYYRAQAIAKNLHSEDSQKRLNARRGLSLAREAEFGEGIDLTKATSHALDLEAYDIVNDLRGPRAVSYFGQNLEGILGSAPEDRLAQRALQIQPMEKTDEAEDHPYNRAVDAHKRFVEANDLLKNYSEGKVSGDELYEKAAHVIAQRVGDALNANPDNQWLTDEEKELVVAARLEIARCSDSDAIREVQGMAGKALADFEAINDNGAKKADYVKQNLWLAANSMGPEHREALMHAFYELTRENGNGN
jgi:hypothetical protein